MQSPPLKLNELKIMLALGSRPRYGLEIVDITNKKDKRQLSLGSLYRTLRKLENLGFVEGSWSEETSDRGGNRRRYYKLTESGKRAAIEQMEGLIGIWLS